MPLRQPAYHPVVHTGLDNLSPDPIHGIKQVGSDMSGLAQISNHIDAVPHVGHDRPKPNCHVGVDDWLNVATDILISEGVEQVKILTIGESLGVSRSSFYWFFKSRADLLLRILQRWEQQNTGSMIAYADHDAGSISEAVCNFFRCVMDPDRFNVPLETAIREWSREDGSVRSIVDRNDEKRAVALTDMFKLHGYDDQEAELRARALYCHHLGYQWMEHGASLEHRLDRVPGYLQVFIGQTPDPDAVEQFRDDMFHVSLRHGG